MAGVVRAHVGLRDYLEALDDYESEHPDEPPLPRNSDFRLLFGSEFRFERFRLVAIAHDLKAGAISASSSPRRACAERPRASTA